MIPGSANPLLLASAAGAAGYQIERSLRFNSSDSAYLSRTPSVAGNRKTWTWAGWVKRSRLGVRQALFAGHTGGAGNYNTIEFITGDSIVFFFNGNASGPATSALFRDLSAWMHVCVALDTTQATANNRVKIYVNGVQQAIASGTYPAQNADLQINATSQHDIGMDGGYDYFSGYLADVHFIDGQALDPTNFGEFDDNGVWQPIAYTGTYNTNGFHLDFADNATAASLGADSSTNGNDWTANNLSVSAGAGNDSLVDTPTNYGTDTGAGGEVRGNYCIANPIDKDSTLTLTNGNLEAAGTAGWAGARGTIGVSSGKWYWEVAIIDGAVGNLQIGVGKREDSLNTSNGISYYWSYGGISSSTGRTGTFSTYANGDTIGFALDLDSGKLEAYKNGTKETAYWSGIPNDTYFPQFTCYGLYLSQIGKLTLNFGQRPFAYTAPSGYKALCTANLPDPQTITTSGSYTGNGVADGPFVFLNGVPTAMTVNGNAVTFGTEADKLSNGFKIRTTNTTYNQNASTYNYSITSTGDPFKTARAQSNP